MRNASEWRLWESDIKWGDYNYSVSGDFNGDGKTDIASAYGENIYMYINKGDRFEPQIWKVSGQWAVSEYTWSADFNGDGKADIATANGENIYMYLSKGNGFESQVWKVPNKWPEARFTTAVDFNRDGKADIISANMNEVYMNLSQGNGFLSQTWSIKPCDPKGGFEEWRWDLNRADQTWPTYGPGTNPKRTFKMYIEDYNNDGKLDFSSVNRVSKGYGIASKVFQQNGSFCITQTTY